jgi:hypothetical protein
MPRQKSESDLPGSQDQDTEMDCEEAIERSRDSWDLSQWARALPK